MKRVGMISAALLMLVGQAHAEMYKCTEGGRVTFQGTPCKAGTGVAVTIKPSSLPEPGTDPAGQLKSKLEATAAADKRKGVEQEIAYLNGRIQSNLRAMDAEISLLRSKKNYARNNLAGATWEQSISGEMQAVTAKYTAENTANQQKIAQLQLQLMAMK